MLNKNSLKCEYAFKIASIKINYNRENSNNLIIYISHAFDGSHSHSKTESRFWSKRKCYVHWFLLSLYF